MKRLLVILSTVFLLVAILPAYAQQAPFAEDIHAFKKQDSLHFPPANAILFVGSSSFTKWKTVQDDFPGYTIINRGFGGSSLPDVIRYANEIIIPYRPKQIVIYCGENDLAASDTVSAQTVFNRFQQLFQLIRAKFPRVPVAFISLKPSPSRAHLFPKMLVANTLIKEFMRKKSNAVFIDVYHKMLQPDGQPMDYLFVEDKLHMNEKGYAIWIKVIQPYLVK
jgi:lysophospholipase L1-like esterase